MSKYCKEYIDMHARINERITNSICTYNIIEDIMSKFDKRHYYLL